MKSPQNTIFTLGQETDVASLFELLRRTYPAHDVSETQLERHYLDSFDWRLYRNNRVCEWDMPGGNGYKKGAGVFFIRDRSTHDGICEYPAGRIPRFSKDITHRACRRLLDEILGIRALMTVATIAVKSRHFNILNKEKKTVVVLRAENHTLTGRVDPIFLTGRLIVSPIRGYRKTFTQVRQYIAEQLQLPVAQVSLLDELLTAMGRVPDPGIPVYAGKFDSSLNTREAVRILLRHLFQVMQTNEPGLRDAIDTEFLHDYRVALRRTRSLLSQIRHVFPARQLEYFKHELFWLGQVSGPMRDLDVYLLKFDAYKQALPEAMQKHIVPFHAFLERHWKIEHARLCRAFDSKRYQKLIKEWRVLLDNDNASAQRTGSQPAVSPETANAGKPVRQIAGSRILKLYRRILREGDAITPESHDEDLHELRKTCKKFRYLIEFFHDFYPEDGVKNLLKTLKQLQDHLGDFQDLCVQTAQLCGFAEQMQQEGSADAKTIMAMGILVEKLNARKTVVRTELEHRFQTFTQPDNKAAFMNTFSLHNQPESRTVR